VIIKKFVAHCGRFYPMDGGLAWTVLDQLHNTLFNSETEAEVTEGEKALAAFLELDMHAMEPSPWRAHQSSKTSKLTNAIFTVRQSTSCQQPLQIACNDGDDVASNPFTPVRRHCPVHPSLPWAGHVTVPR